MPDQTNQKPDGKSAFAGQNTASGPIPPSSGPEACQATEKTGEDELSLKQRRRKTRLEGGAIAVAAIALTILTLVQKEVIDLGPGFSENRGLVALVSINVSVMLTTLLILLTLRHLYRIFFEKQGYGSLQTKMVVAFICLSLLPTILIFYYSYRQLVRGHDLWFSSEIEEALEDSLKLTESMIDIDKRILASFGGDIMESYRLLPSSVKAEEVNEFLERQRSRFHLSSVEIYTSDGSVKNRAGDENLPLIYHEWFFEQLGSSPPWSITLESVDGDLTRLVWPILRPTTEDGPDPAGFLAVGYLSMAPIRSRMEDVRHGLSQYQDALRVQRPFRVTQLTALSAMALLAVFISVWIGSHLARSLASPVLDLVTGTKKVAAGDLDYNLEPQWRSGEFAELVNSFNQMTRDLKKLYVELDSRRRFVETVLKNVSTGVVVMDNRGDLQAFNKAAEDILSGQPAADDKNRENPEPGFTREKSEKSLRLPPALAEAVENMMSSLRSGRRTAEGQVRLNIGESLLSLKLGLAPLRNEEKKTIGYLLAFDDISEQEKAQRLAAWREVARRIAHEVKNPLTPIQLSAQRLQRRFSERLAGEKDADIFEECTEVIIRQVEEMKNLVDEFSRFARLPEIKLRQGDFSEFITESLALFRQAHKQVDFILEVKDEPPQFPFDPEQMRRVLTNILDNAVSAMKGRGEVRLVLEMLDPGQVKLSVTDSGPGLDPQIADRLFDPYVSSKEGGQGLGLAIVRTIINDHGGFIRARNTAGGGARFVIELPVKR